MPIIRWTLFTTLLSLTLASTSQAADALTLLEGQKVEASVAAIDAEGRITGPDVPADLTVDDLRKIETQAPEAAESKPAVVLDLVDGGRIGATSITIEKEKFQVQWALGEPLSFPIDVVRAVRMRPSTTSENFEAALAKPSAENDRIFVEADEQVAMFTGLVESLTAENIVFVFEGKQQTLPTAKLFGIVVAQVSPAAKAKSGVAVELADGSRLAGKLRKLADGQLTLGIGPAAVTVPWNAVQRMTIRSSRLAFLSDLEPSEVQERRIVTLPAPYQRDLNVQQNTLTIGERKFERGIGTHAYSKLVYELDGEYQVFAATIGIDAAAERHGDCVFIVLGDGRELARERMTGQMPAKDLKLAIEGVQQLTLLVEPGEDLDLADLADWADARVIRQGS
jgi:hypothetical protein